MSKDSDGVLWGFAGTEPNEAQEWSGTVVDPIRSFSATDHQLSKVIRQIIQLQESVLARRQSSPDSITATADELHALMNERGGRLLCAFFGEELLGYALVTDLGEFTQLYEDKNDGCLALTQPFDRENSRYLYQISVRPGLVRLGIGKLLLETCKRELGAGGLITDIIVEPRSNHTLHRFFVGHGFEPIGVLHLNADFGTLRSTVLYWNA